MLDGCVKKLFIEGSRMADCESKSADAMASQEMELLPLPQLFDSPSSPQGWDMNFATPGVSPTPISMSVDDCTTSPPIKQQRVFSPLTATVPLSPSPLKFSLHVKPTNLEREFSMADSPLPSPLTSPPQIERLRLFDTPHTPRSFMHRASAFSQQQQEQALKSNLSHPPTPTGHLRCSRVMRSGPELRRRPSRGTNINPFTPKEVVARGKRPREDISPEKASCTPPQHKQLSLWENNIHRFREEFHEVCVIGAGSFGTVYKCINRLDGCVYALKKSHKPVAGSTNEVQALREVYAHAVLGSHPHLVRYYSAWTEDNHMLIQNEYCNGGNLAKMIDQYRQSGQMMREAELKRLMKQVANGLQYIHSMSLVHLDIKPDNIFICYPEVATVSGNSTDQHCTAWGENEERENADDEMLPVYKIGDMGHVTSLKDPQVEEGDCRFLPREVLQEDYHELNKADIFSLGLTVFCAGSLSELPKNGPDWHNIRDGFLPRLTHCSEAFFSLLLSLISPSLSKRPSATEIITHQLICSSAEKTKAQLKKELSEEKFKNEMLCRALQQLKQSAVVVGGGGSSSLASNKRQLVGGPRTNRTMSLGAIY